MLVTRFFSRLGAVDVALYVVILILFASWLTIHVVLCWAIGRRRPWKGWLALFVPPLAPLWGQASGRLAVAWVLALVLYGAALVTGFV